MINIKSFVFNPFQVNCFVLSDESRDCIIVDASCNEENEYSVLFDYIKVNSLKPVALLNTHGHVDHVTGSARVSMEYNIPFIMNPEDNFLLENAVEHGRVFGFHTDPPARPSSGLFDGDVFRFGNSEIRVYHAPGHSPGSLLFYAEVSGFLITGDVLFAGSIGRTDLPGGNYNQLLDSIHKKICVLPPETQVYPGHGSSTSIAEEMENNPFLNRSF
ncbi:MAG: MBL fold metallo-hydrolase [Bacteroidales bacterium]|nr:MBL fold metallo-hydrolase [Bacteroidales bacterium]MCB9013150.1 MBL fold metallo-hydrolase [Bacteroidales bacterium]